MSVVSLVDDCVSVNTNYVKNNVGTTTKEASWRSCAARCKADGDCKAWSYATNDHPVAAYRKNCHLKNSNYKQDTQRNVDGVYSGDSGCGVGMYLLSTHTAAPTPNCLITTINLYFDFMLTEVLDC